jgi:prepilin-type N-terminal cleavage/methylation domain-containing protein
MAPRRGFTLIEVLVALMIFGLTAVVMGGAYLNVLNSYEAAQRSNKNDGEVSFARSQLLGDRGPARRPRPGPSSTTATAT